MARKGEACREAVYGTGSCIKLVGLGNRDRDQPQYQSKDSGLPLELDRALVRDRAVL